MLIQRTIYIRDIDLDPALVSKYNPAEWPMPPGVRLIECSYDPQGQRTILRIECEERKPPLKAIAADDGTIDVEFTVDQNRLSNQ